MPSVRWTQEQLRCELPQLRLSPRQMGRDSQPARPERRPDSYPEMRAESQSPYSFRIRPRFHVQPSALSLEPARGSNRRVSSRSRELPVELAPTRLPTLDGCGLLLQF